MVCETYKALCCILETQNILLGSPCLHSMVRGHCSSWCELRLLLHRSHCTGKTDSTHSILRQLPQARLSIIIISFLSFVHHFTSLHSPPFTSFTSSDFLQKLAPAVCNSIQSMTDFPLTSEKTLGNFSSKHILTKKYSLQQPFKYRRHREQNCSRGWSWWRQQQRSS